MIKRVVEYICNVGGDKYVHLLACLLLTFVIGQGVYLFSDLPMANCAAIGSITAMIIGFFKEWYDEFMDGEVDYKDLVADFIGGVIGLIVTMF